MLTPAQKLMLSRAQSHPKISVLISRLDLIVTPSPEFQRNEKIAERIDGLIEQIRMAPQRPRKITYPRKPWDEPDLSNVRAGECPF